MGHGAASRRPPCFEAGAGSTAERGPAPRRRRGMPQPWQEEHNKEKQLPGQESQLKYADARLRTLSSLMAGATNASAMESGLSGVNCWQMRMS